ncbi:MAG: hypothetical protein ACT4QF_08750 [Sporichthyaceae bacterium]
MRQSFGALALLLTLGACGSGGENPPAAASPPAVSPPPAAAAVRTVAGPAERTWESSLDGGSAFEKGAERAKISADGSHVVFEVPDETGNASGPPSVVVAALPAADFADVCTACRNPHISADGSLVAYESKEPQAGLGDTDDRSDVFVKDLETGAVRLVSTGNPAEGVGHAYLHSMSADGTKVAFVSDASYDPDAPTKPVDPAGAAWEHAYVANLTEGRIRLVSSGSAYASSPLLSGDGDTVAFAEYRDRRRLWIRELATGTAYDLGERLGYVPPNGLAIWDFTPPSDDGARLVFSVDSDADPARRPARSATPAGGGLFLADLRTGQTFRALGPEEGSAYPAAYLLDMDAAGRRVVFAAANEVHLLDLAERTVRPLSQTRPDFSGAAAGSEIGASISADGQTVAYDTVFPQVAEGRDVNNSSDVYLVRVSTAG